MKPRASGTPPRRLPLCSIAPLLLLTACMEDTPAAGEERLATSAERPGEPLNAEPAVPPAGLAGTSWQLVSIRAADGSEETPDDPAKYTLAFQADGRVAVRADCNRGSGPWAVEGSNLELGPLAMTRAMCPPGSLHDRFVVQLGLVRTYAVEAGRLRLATRDEAGYALEFEPVPEPGSR